MLMIIGMHTNLDKIVADDKYTSCIGTTCGIAIPLFFMVSGYLISKKDITFQYILHKELGILRFVLYANIIYLPIELLVYKTSDLSNFYVWFIQKGVFWQFWYLGAMVLMYSMTPILNKIIYSSNWQKWLIGMVMTNFIFFLLNIFVGFEQKMIQTFIIWEWIMYYFIGGLLRKNQVALPKVHLYTVLGLAVLYRILYSICGIGNQYLFGSVVCCLFASSVFIYVVNKQFPAWLTGGGNLFLPVYTIHIFIIHILGEYTILVGWPPIIRYITYFFLFSIISIGFSLIIIRIPYSNRIFKI